MERSSVAAMYNIPNRVHGANMAELIKDRKWKTSLGALTGIFGDQFQLLNISFVFTWILKVCIRLLGGCAIFHNGKFEWNIFEMATSSACTETTVLWFHMCPSVTQKTVLPLWLSWIYCISSTSLYSVCGEKSSLMPKLKSRTGKYAHVTSFLYYLKIRTV